MTVAELIEELKKLPQNAEVCVDRGGAYDDAKKVEFYPPQDKRVFEGSNNGQVFISADSE